jgi:hypothetical protein
LLRGRKNAGSGIGAQMVIAAAYQYDRQTLA